MLHFAAGAVGDSEGPCVSRWPSSFAKWPMPPARCSSRWSRPNPKRKHGTDNYGDVWVVATYQPPGAARDGADRSDRSDKSDKSIRARAHLLVTVPLYIKWDQPEVGR